MTPAICSLPRERHQQRDLLLHCAYSNAAGFGENKKAATWPVETSARICHFVAGE
jgi:hypothetical protein